MGLASTARGLFSQLVTKKGLKSGASSTRGPGPGLRASARRLRLVCHGGRSPRSSVGTRRLLPTPQENGREEGSRGRGAALCSARRAGVRL